MWKFIIKTMSIRNLPTLKGVFPDPKVQPKRDFLRENKLKLKELQKQRLQKKQSLENEKSEKLTLKYSRNNSRQQLNPLTVDNKLKKRSISVNTLTTNQRLNSPCPSCCSGPHICRSLHSRCCNLIAPSIQQTNELCHPVQYCNNNNNNKIIAKIIDKETQTDDIMDEEYLNDALKRCSSRDIHHPDIIDNNLNLNLNLSPHQLPNDNYEQNYDVSSVCQQNRYNNNNVPCHDKQSTYQHSIAAPSETNPSHLDFQNLKIHHDHQHETTTNHYNNTNHFPKRKSTFTKQLGAPDFKNRTDIRLPKYLEKEKRERELYKLREMEKDPNCPEGHHVLGEQDRQDALKLAHKKFEDLIKELNHMPMTSETLRTRTRKNEIEKALVELEHDIRNFSKQKVYVRGNGLGDE